MNGVVVALVVRDVKAVHSHGNHQLVGSESTLVSGEVLHALESGIEVELIGALAAAASGDEDVELVLSLKTDGKLPVVLFVDTEIEPLGAVGSEAAGRAVLLPDEGVGAVGSLEARLANALAVKAALSVTVTFVHGEAHEVSDSAVTALLLASELVVLDEVGKDGVGSRVVVVGEEVARLRHSDVSKGALALEVATDVHLTVVLVVVDGSVSLPEFSRDVEQLTHPEDLAGGSILHVELTGLDDKGEVVVNEPVVVVRVVNQVVEHVTLTDGLGSRLENGVLGAVIDVQSSIELVLLGGVSQQEDVGLFNGIPLVFEHHGVVGQHVARHSLDVAHDETAGIGSLGDVVVVIVAASLLEGIDLVQVVLVDDAEGSGHNVHRGPLDFGGGVRVDDLSSLQVNLF
mmetsp:Transcript_573/g.642  ORF Transcript_573/g.642 Transcript_573/m.642 type:complete len:402 (-) Transcript_573:62-1267(-)